MNQRTLGSGECLRRLPPEGLSKYHFQASKKKTRSSYSVQKSETCVCKGRGGREAVHSPTRRAPHRCHQAFFSPHSQAE